MLSPKTVALSVNTPALLDTLRHTFTSGSSVLTELTQNGRRAGATAITVTMTETTLTVADDGCGITDFAQLLSVASSGWSEELQREEQPYGLGLLAALYAAKRITIRSNGHRIEADTTDILAMKPIELKPDDIAQGAVITLDGLLIPPPNQGYGFLDEPPSIALSVGHLWKGFPIPVTVNGEEILRADGIGPDFERFEAGWIRVDLDSIALLGSRYTASGRNVYLQGHPVTKSMFDGGITVHLDPTAFRGRAPDRTHLLDADRAQRTIDRAVKQHVRKKVVQASKTRAPEWLADNMGLLKAVDAIDLLNQIDLLPDDLIYHAVPSSTNLNVAARCEAASRSGPYSREAISEMGLITDYARDMWSGLWSNNPEDGVEACADLNALVYLHAVNGARIATHWLDPKHWVFSLPNYVPEVWTKPLPSESAAITENNAYLLTETADELSVEPVKAARLMGPCGEQEVRFMLVAHAEGSPTVIAGPNACTETMVEAFRSFEDENDNFDEQEALDASRRLAAALALTTGKSDGCAEVADSIRNSAQLESARQNLRGRSMRIDFSADGGVTATLIED